jgi:competence protein ComEA
LEVSMFKKSICFILVVTSFMVSASLFAASYSGKININSASAQELVQLPYIGEKRAQAIVDFRKANPFSSVGQLAKVKGVSEKVLAKIQTYLSVKGQTTFTVSK